LVISLARSGARGVTGAIWSAATKPRASTSSEFDVVAYEGPSRGHNESNMGQRLALAQLYPKS